MLWRNECSDYGCDRQLFMQYGQITGKRKEEDENKMENAVNEVCTKEAMEEAKRLIKEEAASFVVIKEGKIQYQDKGIGVRPIMQVLSKDKELLKGAVIVDKMIGKAAAMLLSRGGAVWVHGVLMSEAAENYLAGRKISFSFDESIPFVSNRTNDGLCPLEDAVTGVLDEAEAYEKLKERIAFLMSKR